MGRGVLFALLFVACAAQAQQHGDRIEIVQPLQEDFYGAGRRIEVRAPVDGDVVVAGQAITIGAPVRQDVIAAGEIVTIAAPIGDDLRLAGREVRIAADVAGHLVAAGAIVELAAGHRVASFAWLAGREVNVAGEVGGDLKAAGETVRIGGHVRGNAQVHAQRLELLPGARIDGSLAWEGGEPRLDPNASVGGTITGEPRPKEEREHHWGLWAGLLFVATLVVTGLLLYLLFPRAAERAALAVRERPLLAAVLGFATLILIPFVILLLFVTGIGWLLALILLALYLVALPVGWLLGVHTLARMTLARVGRTEMKRAATALVLVLAIVLAAVLQLIPVVGWLLGLWLLWWGLGSMLLLLGTGVRESRA